MRQIIRAIAAAAIAASLCGCTPPAFMMPAKTAEQPADPATETAAQTPSPQTDPGQQTPVQPPTAGSTPGQMATNQPQTQQQPQTQPQQTAQADTTGMPQPEQTGPRSPMLGSPGGVLATQKSIYGSSAPQAPALSPTVANAGSVRFLPIIGAPLAAVTPLSQELANAANSRGLVIKPSSDNSANFMLKGYFAAQPDGRAFLIAYVWDVLDAGGNRLTRLQGQETVAGKSNDPWANVPPEIMQKIASDTINKYLAWKASYRG